MSDFKVNLDISALLKYLENFAKEVDADVKKSIKALAIDSHNHIKEQAQNKLHSFRAQYLESLGQAKEVDAYNWVIVLNKNASWLEEGKDAWDMKGKPGQWGLLKESETIKSGPNKGKHYKIIPLEHGKPPNEEASGRTIGENGEPIGKGFEQNMTKLLKSELKKRGIPTGRFNKLELDKNGSPRGGKINSTTGIADPYRVSSFDIKSPYPGKKASSQIFERVNVYQKLNKKTGGVERHFTTFRMAIEDDGKWEHPAAPALKIFEETQKWAENKWTSDILPSIMAKYEGK